MASTNELVELNKQGDLGKMLAAKFNGEIGRVLPINDKDFMIGFASREATPSSEDIGKAVIEHYIRIGYKVEHEKNQGQNCFQAIVFADTKYEGFMSITITTYYPLVSGDDHNHLRVNTNVMVI